MDFRSFSLKAEEPPFLYRSPGVLEMTFFKKIFHAIFSQENLYALLVFLIFVALAVFTASTAPVWIYQGF
jgi:lipopolysaccharide/colanic/teichoic acid biosynthesis glycosyltransferase